MNDLVWAIALLGALCAAIIMVGGLLGFARWALSRVVSLAFAAIRGLLGFLAFASRWLATALQRAVAFVFATVAKLLRRAGQALLEAAHRLCASFREGWRQKAAGMKAKKAQAKSDEANGAEDSGPEAKAEADDEAGDGKRQQDQRAEPEASSAYQQALEVMGLEGVEPLTNALLRERYGAMIRVLHPDKGFANRIFAQQVNAAVMTIKKAHGWR